MIPFRHADERLYNAVRRVRMDRIPEDRMVVHIHPRVRYEVLTDPLYWRYHIAAVDPQTILGFPIKVDPSLPEHGIVLRYEVVA